MIRYQGATTGDLDRLERNLEQDFSKLVKYSKHHNKSPQEIFELWWLFRGPLGVPGTTTVDVLRYKKDLLAFTTSRLEMVYGEEQVEEMERSDRSGESGV